MPKRKRKDPLDEDVEKAQPLLDILLEEEDVDFTVENIIEATKYLDELDITLETGKTISEQLWSMVEWLRKTPTATKRRRTRSQTAPLRDALNALNEKIENVDDTITYLREQRSLENRAPAPVGNRGDGNFYITAVKMGQGDCTLIATPGGRVIMIDCGSDATETTDDTDSEDTSETKSQYRKRIRGTIYDKKFLKGRNIIDILILTHADTDHYNKIPTMFRTDVQVREVYHSGSISDYSSKGGTKKAISAWLADHSTRSDSIKAVSHNEDSGVLEITINDEDVEAQDDSNKTDRKDSSNGLCIVNEPNCKVTILASNVHHIYKIKNTSINDQSNEKNRGSVVTLIEVFGKKILICGDATRNTEAYLIRTHKNRIKNLSISQAPHHGSNNTSSGGPFVEVINPQEVLVSAGKKVKKDHLPSYATLLRYESKMSQSKFDEIDEHRVFYWLGSSTAGYNLTNSFTERPIFITGSWGTVEKKIIDPS